MATAVMTPGKCAAIGGAIREYVRRGHSPEEARQLVCRAAARAIRAELRAERGMGMYDGQYYPGLGGPVSSQADYTLLSNTQKRAIFIQSEISGIGKEEWNRALQSDALKAAGWTPWENYGYDNMMGFWLSNIKSILTTDKKPAMLEQVNEVARLATGSEKLVALVKQNVSAEAAAKASSDRAEAEAMLARSTLTSPGDVAWNTFQEEVVARAKSLTSGGIGIVTIAAISAGLLAAVFFLKK